MTDRACQTCKKPIPADAAGGLCPLCLLREGIEPGTLTSGGASGTPVDSSEVEEASLTQELAGRYTTLEGTGQGGMGKVYLVRDTQLGREIALKELIPRGAEGSPEADQEERVALARFTREARVTAQLQHPAITPVYELGRRVDGSYYYTMKYVRGRTLAAVLKEARTLDDRLKLLPHFVALCHAIAFAHSRGVIHRDIKPANVMVGDFGETVVVDWGLAKIKGIVERPAPAVSPDDETLAAGAPGAPSQDRPPADGLQTMHGTALGTPAYMPPEQAQGLIGSLDQRSDIYSLGAVLYEILSGRRPFAGTTAREVLTEVLTRPPTPLGKVDPGIPKEYARICERAMSRDPDQRPATASELAELVQGVRLPRPKGAARRFLERAALLGLLLIPLSLIGLNRWTDAEVRRTLTRLSAKGFDLRTGPLDWEPSSLPSPVLPTGARHGAGALYAITWEFPQLGDRESDLWKRVTALDVLEASFPWPKGSEKERAARELSSEVGPVLAAVRATAALPRGGGRMVLKKAMGGEGTPASVEIPTLRSLMSGATLLSHSAYLSLVDGQVDRALETSTAGLRFASHLADVPFIISILTRSNIANRTLAPLESAPLGQASDQTLTTLQRTLEESLIGPSVPFGVESEIRGILFAFNLVEKGRGAEVGSLLRDANESASPVLWAIYGRGPLRWWANWDESLMLSFLTDALDSARRPPSEGLPDLRRIDAEVARLDGGMHPMLAMLPSITATVERVAGTDAALTRARVRVALERYRRVKGAFPESLTDLVPEWTQDLPIDVFSGAPFEYARTPEGYKLRSPRDPTRVPIDRGSGESRPIS